MRVLIDAIAVTRKKAGVGVYAKNLIDHLIGEKNFELFLLVQDDDPDFDYKGLPHVTVLRVPSRLLRKVPLRLLFEQTFLPWLLWRHRIDVVHSLHYSFPLLRFRTRAAVTIHDLTSLSMPEVHIGAKMRYYRFFIRRSRRSADALIFVSQSAQRDFVARFGQPRGLSTVIYHGKDPVFRPTHETALLGPVWIKYGVPARYILYVGTIEPRKNLERLVDAFATLASSYPDLSLVIAGMMGWKQEHLFSRIRQLGLEARILFPGFIAEEDKPLLIAGCAMFVYPSLYEGFGLPVLEALASGAPTITSNISSLPEVAGTAALLVDPYNTQAIAEAMDAVLSNTGLQSELREKGPLQAGAFSWQTAAQATGEVYRTLAAQSRRNLRKAT